MLDWRLFGDTAALTPLALPPELPEPAAASAAATEAAALCTSAELRELSCRLFSISSGGRRW